MYDGETAAIEICFVPFFFHYLRHEFGKSEHGQSEFGKSGQDQTQLVLVGDARISQICDGKSFWVPDAIFSIMNLGNLDRIRH